MYDKGIIHRDINLSNILLKINNNLNKITFKLSDYGSTKYYHKKMNLNIH